jgi:hypothetical protein
MEWILIILVVAFIVWRMKPAKGVNILQQICVESF